MTFIDKFISASKEDDKLSDSLKEQLSKYSRPTLLKIWRSARDRGRQRGAYFWRNLKTETWCLLAGPGEQKDWRS